MKFEIRLRKIKNKNGNTTPAAVAFMLLLMALAGSILLVATYRFQNAYIRKQQNQLYIYATSVVEEYSDVVKAGGMNKGLGDAVEKAKMRDVTRLSAYAKSYTFRYTLGKQTVGGAVADKTIDNFFNEEELGIKINVTYEPANAGAELPSEKKEYVQIGDRMKAEYRISVRDYEYRITAHYYCSKDANKGTDGSVVDNIQYKNMQWSLDRFSGKIYTS